MTFQFSTNVELYGWTDMVFRQAIHDLHPEYVGFGKTSGSGAKDRTACPEGNVLHSALNDAKSGSNYHVVNIEDDEVLVSVNYYENATDIYVASKSAAFSLEYGRKLVDQFCQEPPEQTARRVPTDFWYLGSEGPTRTRRNLEVSPWSEISRNYSQNVIDKLDELIKLKAAPDAGRGRIIILHGEAGTGKTNAIRALSSEWRDWALPAVVLDPDVMLQSPGYMIEIASREEQGKTPLIVLEDSGELASTQSRGQMMSRLLNMADGLATQWTKAMFLVTTNEAIGDLGAAITRPGRCLAAIEVGALTAEESGKWLGETVSGPMTIAELYARRNSGEVIQHRDKGTADTGMYL